MKSCRRQHGGHRCSGPEDAKIITLSLAAAYSPQLQRRRTIRESTVFVAHQLEIFFLSSLSGVTHPG